MIDDDFEEEAPRGREEPWESETVGEVFDLASDAEQRRWYKDHLSYRGKAKTQSTKSFDEYAQGLHRRKWWKLTPDLKREWTRSLAALGSRPESGSAAIERWEDAYRELRKHLILTMIARHRGTPEPSRAPARKKPAARRAAPPPPPAPPPPLAPPTRRERAPKPTRGVITADDLIRGALGRK